MPSAERNWAFWPALPALNRWAKIWRPPGLPVPAESVPSDETLGLLQRLLKKSFRVLKTIVGDKALVLWHYGMTKKAAERVISRVAKDYRAKAQPYFHLRRD